MLYFFIDLQMQHSALTEWYMDSFYKINLPSFRVDDSDKLGSYMLHFYGAFPCIQDIY